MAKVIGINSSGVPVGTLIANQSTHTVAPAGTLYCDGSMVSKTVYAALYLKLVGQVTENATQFALPDLRGRFLRSLDTTAATVDPDKASRAGGDANKLGSRQGHAFQTHSHQYSDYYGADGQFGGTPIGTPEDSGGDGVYTYELIKATSAASASGSTAQTTLQESRPINFATNYFIAYA